RESLPANGGGPPGDASWNLPGFIHASWRPLHSARRPGDSWLHSPARSRICSQTSARGVSTSAQSRGSGPWLSHPQRDRGTGGPERFSAQEMPATPKLIVVGKALVHHFLCGWLRKLSKLRLIVETQTHEFHGTHLPSGHFLNLLGPHCCQAF